MRCDMPRTRYGCDPSRFEPFALGFVKGFNKLSLNGIWKFNGLDPQSVYGRFRLVHYAP